MSSQPSQVLIAANPKSGAGPSAQRVAELQAAITAAGFSCDTEHSLNSLRRRALELDARGELRAVVSAGGDGTAEALANLLPGHIPLLLFPLGTENLLAKHWRITGDVQQACAILRSDRRIAMDVGSANGKLFLVMLSCGFDADVVQRMHAIRAGHISRWSYARPIWGSLLNYRFPQLGWSIDPPQPVVDGPMPQGQSGLPPPPTQSLPPGQSLPPSQSRTAAWLFVFNVPRYAAALDFCPQADPTDGLLDVCSFQRSGLASGVGYLTRLWLGSHQQMRDFAHVRCRHLEIPAPVDHNGQSISVPFQVDGDPGGVLPLSVEVLPGRLTLLVPEI